jgi:RNA polymerase sigma-70 factor, ECF subfamily
MRRVLLDHARERGVQKRGGGAFKVSFDEGLAVAAPQALDLLALDELEGRTHDRRS